MVGHGTKKVGKNWSRVSTVKFIVLISKQPFYFKNSTFYKLKYDTSKHFYLINQYAYMLRYNYKVLDLDFINTINKGYFAKTQLSPNECMKKIGSICTYLQSKI